MLHHGCMLLTRLADVSREVAATSARSRKIALLAALFRDAQAQDVPIVIPYLAGRLPQGRLGIGWKALSRPVAPAAAPTLTVREVDARLTALGALSGPGSQAERARLVGELMGAATEDEQRFLIALITGEVRQGALDAVAVEGLAEATAAPPADVRRAVMLAGSLRTVAEALLTDGRMGTGTVPAHGRPPGAADARAHRVLGGRGRRQAGRLRGGGEAGRHPRPGPPGRRHRTGLHPHPRRHHRPAARTHLGGNGVERRTVHPGRRGHRPRRRRLLPRSFQETAGRVGSRADVATAAAAVPVSPVFFDALSVDGRDLLDLPFFERHAELARLVPEPMRVRRTVLAGEADLQAAEDFLEETLARGHEGVVEVPRRALQRGPRRVLAEVQARAHARPGGPGRRAGSRPAAPASSPTFTSAPAPPTAASRCSARPSRA